MRKARPLPRAQFCQGGGGIRASAINLLEVEYGHRECEIISYGGATMYALLSGAYEEGKGLILSFWELR